MVVFREYTIKALFACTSSLESIEMEDALLCQVLFIVMETHKRLENFCARMVRIESLECQSIIWEGR
jgi:hypothetical protein